MRLIDADALRKMFPEDYDHPLYHFTGIWAAIGVCPTIDAAPVRRGEWHVCQDVDGNEYGKCSYCGGETYDGDNDTFDQPPDFCQHCGADMRGEARHEPEA